MSGDKTYLCVCERKKDRDMSAQSSLFLCLFVHCDWKYSIRISIWFTLKWIKLINRQSGILVGIIAIRYIFAFQFVIAVNIFLSLDSIFSYFIFRQVRFVCAFLSVFWCAQLNVHEKRAH